MARKVLWDRPIVVHGSKLAALRMVILACDIILGGKWRELDFIESSGILLYVRVVVCL